VFKVKATHSVVFQTINLGNQFWSVITPYPARDLHKIEPETEYRSSKSRSDVPKLWGIPLAVGMALLWEGGVGCMRNILILIEIRQ
jgi:hypothetical protein